MHIFCLCARGVGDEGTECVYRGSNDKSRTNLWNHLSFDNIWAEGRNELRVLLWSGHNIGSCVFLSCFEGQNRKPETAIDQPKITLTLVGYCFLFRNFSILLRAAKELHKIKLNNPICEGTKLLKNGNQSPNALDNERA